MKVAIFPCGSEAGLEIYNSLKDVKGVELFGASSVPCHGQATYANYDSTLPFITDPSFEERFNAYLLKNEIDYVFPAYDDVIVRFGEFAATMSAVPVMPQKDVCDIARSKVSTYQALSDMSFCPDYCVSPVEIDSFPVFAKPDRGQGSQGVALIRDMEELKSMDFSGGGYVFCEHLSGAEFTIDCFTDRHGKLKVCLMRQRERVKSGISVRTSSLDTPDEVLGIAEDILTQIPLRGMWFFQLKMNSKGQYKLLEIATRVAGSMAITRIRGANLPMMSLLDLQGIDINVNVAIDSVTLERSLANKYLGVLDFDHVYLDFDDTVTRHGKLSIVAMQFIYHCRNRKIPVTLLTRHAEDIDETLLHYAIDRNVFEDINHITDSTSKHLYIAATGMPIFIDDSFSERRSVSENLGIPCFGPESFEALIDWSFE